MAAVSLLPIQQLLVIISHVQGRARESWVHSYPSSSSLFTALQTIFVGDASAPLQVTAQVVAAAAHMLIWTNWWCVMAHEGQKSRIMKCIRPTQVDQQNTCSCCLTAVINEWQCEMIHDQPPEGVPCHNGTTTSYALWVKHICCATAAPPSE